MADIEQTIKIIFPDSDSESSKFDELTRLTEPQDSGILSFNSIDVSKEIFSAIQTEADRKRRFEDSVIKLANQNSINNIFCATPSDILKQCQKRYWEHLRLQAVYKRLPDFLKFTEIGYLLGYEPVAFDRFMRNEPLETLNGGATKEQFKLYLQSINKWPVINCLLENWWADDKHNDAGRRDQQIRIICETARNIDYNDLLNIPLGGKAAIKKECMKNHPHLFTEDAFKRAWTEAGKRGLIRIEKKEDFLSKQ